MADWPQWRGPRRDGISTDASWDADAAPEKVWSTNVGLGYSTVSIQAGRLYTIGHDPDADEDSVFCLDARTGERVWTHRYPAETLARMHGGGSLSTPSVDGDRVFVSDREGRVMCLDAATGKPRWEKDLATEHGVKMPQWGFAASPLLLGDTVFVNFGYVFAFDQDGELRWRTKRNYGDCYSTPVDATFGDQRCLVVFSGAGLTLLALDTGAELDTYKWDTSYSVNAATPVVAGDRIFISSGYNKGCALLRARDGQLEPLWESKAMRNHMSGCVHYEGHLYGFDESTFKCLDLDGEVRWAQRGLGKGAFVVAGGRLVLLTGRGELVVADASPDAFRERSRTEVLSDGVYWTTPVVWDRKVYCRSSAGELVCLALGGRGDGDGSGSGEARGTGADNGDRSGDRNGDRSGSGGGDANSTGAGAPGAAEREAPPRPKQ